MHVKPPGLIDRNLEWAALARLAERKLPLAVVYGPRRVGKSFLLDAFAEVAGGRRYQAITGTATAQLDDFARELGQWLGAGPLHLEGWADALERLSRLDTAFVAIDELPYLTEEVPELPGLLQRHVDFGKGPPLILAGSAMSVMAGLVDAQAPLFGRAAAIVVPSGFAGADLAELWGLKDNPRACLWVDAALGGLPGYRPLLASPGSDLDAWMVEEVLAPSSPLLDAAVASLAVLPEPSPLRGIYRSVLAAIASGERNFAAIARKVGIASGALSRPLATLERAGLVARVPDPLRSRRDRYELADPHLPFWLAVIAPHRSRLQAGQADAIWSQMHEATWPAQILGPRWEAVARAHLSRGGEKDLGPVDVVGMTTVADRTQRRNHEVDLVGVRAGKVVALGEAKLRRLDQRDLERLTRIRALLDAPAAKLILASATGVDLAATPTEEVITIGPGDVYGSRPMEL